MAPDDELSLNAWAVLTLLVDDGQQHGFALARKLERGTDLGRVWSVSRPLVYRALDQLDRRGLVTGGPEVPSSLGPRRQEFSATARGVEAVTHWRHQPVDRLRQVRPDLILKLTLTRRAGLDLGPLIAAQQERFASLSDELRVADDADASAVVVDVWRDELARAVDRTLARLAGRRRG